MAFRDLVIGDRFVFASEREEPFRYSGIARGPWIKISPRKYRKIETLAPDYRVGSVSVPVIRQVAQARP